ncbi:MAG: hypothetical protein H6Q89_1486, partial [Myxococcaceae bacterium]|nr:hypothetical protein [Myxococcaceae bacterium]
RGVSPTGCTAYEPNNSIATATLLSPGTYPQLEICGTTELDIFKVQIPAMSVLTTSIKFVNATGNLDLYLGDGTVDAQGYLNTLDASSTTTFNEEEVLNLPFATATTVYVIVDGAAGAVGKYDLKITVTPGVTDRDCFASCKMMTQMTGATAWGTAQANTDGYFMVTPSKYAWGRKDLVGLLKYATDSVQVRFPGTANDAVAVSDICQADGLTPGTDVGSPRHPTTTHVRGNDVDVAYFQNDGKSNYQIICGPGTDTNGNGSGGTYNDGQFCTTNTNVVDIAREVFFLAKLAESPDFRVVGVDQTLAAPFRAQALTLYNAGEIGVRQYRRITEGLGFGAAGGWQYHHHHIHLSLYE